MLAHYCVRMPIVTYCLRYLFTTVVCSMHVFQKSLSNVRTARRLACGPPSALIQRFSPNDPTESTNLTGFVFKHLSFSASNSSSCKLFSPQQQQQRSVPNLIREIIVQCLFLDGRKECCPYRNKSLKLKLIKLNFINNKSYMVF